VLRELIAEHLLTAIERMPASDPEEGS